MEGSSDLATPAEFGDILASWALDADFEALRSSWHRVFRARRNGELVYLRLTPLPRRPDEVRAELEWMESLRAQGLPVVGVCRNRSGENFELRRLRAGEVGVSCFEAAPGRLTEKGRDYREPVVENWARLLAGLHEHARSFAPRHPTARRRPWFEDSVLKIALEAARDSTEPEAAPFRKLVDRFRELGRTRPVLLSHADLHLGNLSVTPDDALHVFDFDDACYHFPEHDVAVALVSIRKAAWELPGRVDAPALEAALLRHYGRPLADLDLWCAYRIGLSYFWALGSARAGAFDEERLAWLRKSTPWWKAQFGSLTKAT